MRYYAAEYDGGIFGIGEDPEAAVQDALEGMGPGACTGDGTCGEQDCGHAEPDIMPMTRAAYLAVQEHGYAAGSSRNVVRWSRDHKVWLTSRAESRLRGDA